MTIATPSAPPPWRVLVTGSRDWADIDLVRFALTTAVFRHLPAVIVHGACPSGADAVASWWVKQFARNLDITEERHPADWAAHQKAAGFRRNAEMVSLGADICLAFINPCVKPGCAEPEPHGSHGASQTADLADKAGIPVHRYPLAGDDT